MKGYHVDRSGKLKHGDVIELNSDYEFPTGPQETWDAFADIFRDGLSNQGSKYFFCGEDMRNPFAREAIGELACEFIRMKKYPEITPSRIKAFFAFEQLADAIDFNKNQSSRIYEIEADHFFRADMNFCPAVPDNCNLSMPELFWQAYNYWGEIYTNSPIFELLFEPPITILKEIKVNNHKT